MLEFLNCGGHIVTVVVRNLPLYVYSNPLVMRGKNPPIILTLYISVLGIYWPSLLRDIIENTSILPVTRVQYSSKQYMGARNRVGLGLLCRPARLHSLAELVPWNRILGLLKV